MKSQHQFSQVPRADIPRSSFDLSHGLKTSFDVDFLVPILVMDIIPGDTMNIKANFFARLATPLHPILDNMYLETQFFFVPYRTIWNDFEKFHGAQDDPGDSIDFTIPILGSASGVSLADLGDYMGLPKTWNAGTNPTSSLPFRAYRKIWNEWYRDENLQDSKVWIKTAGPDTSAETGYTDPPLKRGKRFDYFTSCLPAPQKGTAVSVPLGTVAPVVSTGPTVGPTFKSSADASSFGLLNQLGTTPVVWQNDQADGAAHWLATGLEADLTGATASTINDIRLAFQTQRLLERDARSGTRYVESLKAHWGVTSPDFRLQRAEFLGGGSSAVNITPVANNTAIDSANDPNSQDRYPGELGGFGTVSGRHGFSKSFVEHGVLLGIVNVRGDITYSQGLDRYWSKQTRYEFYYPVLSGIGEQATLNSEIWVDGTSADDTVFGYQERYAEYRFCNSRLSGLFRVDATGTLASWHLSEDFATRPVLGATFITANTGVPLDRAITVNTEPHFLADIYFEIKAARPLPTYGTPGNLDRL